MNLSRRLSPVLVSFLVAHAIGCTSTKDLGSDGTNGSSSMGGSGSASSGQSSSATSGGSASMSTTNAMTGGATSTSTTGGTTVGGSTQGSTSSGGSTGSQAGCDPFPNEGDPCTDPGASCSNGCTDQCQFCNLMQCTDGTWMPVEVSPAPCLDCGPLCDLVVPAGCSAGPPDVASCVSGCQDLMASGCATQFSDARACAGTTPSFMCSDTGEPTVAGCEQQFDTLYACMAG